MGMGLHAGYPVFAEAFNTVVGELDRHLLRPLREVMWGHDENLLNSTEFAQPALFAVEVALFRLLGSWGVRPDFVMGHSIGELSAAHVAGVLSLENAAVLVAARGRLMQALPAGGAMVAVQAAEEEVRPLLSAEVDIAAVNGPASLVISGAQNAVAAVADQLRADGRRVHQLAVSHAFHSPLMDPMIDEFAAVAAGIAIGRPTIGVISNVTGQLAGDDFGSAAYWRRHIRQAVRFADSVRFAQAAGGSRFLEVGPSGGLVASIEESLPDVAVTTMSALRKDRPEPATLTNAVAQGFVTGMDLDWRAVVGEAQFVELPTYAFQRRRFWLSGDGVAADAAGLGLAASEHALLGAVIDLPASGGVVLTGRLSPSVQGWLADHSVAGVTIFPGAGFVELAIRAGDEVGCGVVDELTLAAPLVLPASGSVAVQVVVNGPDESGVRGVSVYSRGDVGTGWVLHAEGALRAGSAEPTADLAMWPPAGVVPVEVADGYQQLAERGYGYGPAFRGLTAMWRRGDEVFAEVALPADAGVSVTGFGVHPVLLDAALHAVVLSAESAERGQGSVLVPFSWQGVSLHAAGASAVRARIAPVGPSAVSIELADGSGLPVLSVASMLARPVTDQQLRAAVSSSGPDRLFEVTWSPQPSAAVEPLPVCAWGTTEDSAAVVFESVPLAGDVVAGVYAATSSVLDVLQSWLTRDGAGVLVVMTRGAVALPGEDVTDLAGAAVWGLVRSAQTEHPGRIVLVDSDAPLDDSALAAVVTTGEPQVLWRRGEVYTARVHGSRAVGGLLVPPSDRPWRLAMSTAGTFENLRLELIPDADAPLGPGQVRVAVSAIAANFRDVMIALGLYPDPDAVMGVEACGVVIETSLNKGSFAVGDRVMGLFPEGTGTVASTDQRLLVKVPAGWSHTAAATTSVVFATAHYALVDLAAARSGQRVLIHAGTGGVGMAAVQLARHLGLEVFATANELAGDQLGGSVVRGTATAAGKTVFVFPGQGSQSLGMGIELLDTAPAFAQQIDACAEAFAEFVDWSLVDVLRGAPGAPGLDRVDVVQPVLFAVMVSLAELWKSVAVHPDAVIGHSQGEIAAAYVAGALSLRDAARVVTLRSKLLAGLAGPGGMVSIACGADQARDLLAPFGDRVSIAVVNGPSAVVVSGEVGALEELIAVCSTKELRTRRIEVDYASHSVEVEAIRGPLAEALSGIEPRSTRTVFFSTVTGNRLDTAGLDADYWYRNVRQTVLFDQAVRNACEQGYRTFIESSPHPALITGVEETFAACTDGDSEAIVVPTLGRGDGGLHRFLLSAASAFVAGVAVNWRGTLDGAGYVELPTYAFDKRRFWLSAEGSGADVSGLGLGASEHPLLGAVVDLPASGGVVLTGRLSPNVQPWLADHAVSDVVLFPGTGFVELAIRAGDEVGCSVLDELTLAAPLLLPATGSVAVQVVVDAGRDSNSRGVSIFSRADAQAGWLLHAEGILRPGSVEPGADLSVWPPAGAVTVDVADGYERLATRGYRYGPAFRGLTAMWARGEEIFAEVRLPEAAGGVGGFGVHPALLDAVLHAVVIAGDPDELALPFAWQGVSLHATGASAVRARIAPAGPSAVSVELADGLGLPVLSVASMVARPVTERQLLAAVSGSGPDRLFEVIWSPASAATSPGPTPAYQIFESVAADQDPVAGSYVRSHQALAAVQSWLTDHESGVLVVATRGAMALPREDVADLAGAAVWGLVRSAQTEHPGRIVLVDSDAATDDAAIAMALATGEPQVVLRGGQVYTARVRGSRAADAILVPPGDGPWRLGLGSAGTFENLRLEPVPNADAPLGPGQVRVAMRAIAANFRDIMITLGMFTHDALLGGEGAGVVVEVGPGVTEFSVGDSVFGFFPDGSGTLVAGDVRLLLPMPADWSYAEAAAISAVFTTAYYAFIHLADVQPGQRVLIHAGTGGVGMAAVQLARHLGLEVFATATPSQAAAAASIGPDPGPQYIRPELISGGNAPKSIPNPFSGCGVANDI